MAVIIRSCAICSLRTACFFIAFYTIVRTRFRRTRSIRNSWLPIFQALAVLLLAANIHDYYQAPDYIVWARITSFVFAVLLFLAGVCLIGGLMKVSGLSINDTYSYDSPQLAQKFSSVFLEFPDSPWCVDHDIYFLRDLSNCLRNMGNLLLQQPLLPSGTTPLTKPK